MAKPEWGSKRFCQNKECEVSSYYDFDREPVHCPACGAGYDPETVLKSRRARSVPVEDPKDDREEEVEDDLDDDDDDDDNDGAEGEDVSGDDNAVLADEDAQDEVVPKIDEDRLGEADDDEGLVENDDLDGSQGSDGDEDDVTY